MVIDYAHKHTQTQTHIRTLTYTDIYTCTHIYRDSQTDTPHAYTQTNIHTYRQLQKVTDTDTHNNTNSTHFPSMMLNSASDIGKVPQPTTRSLGVTDPLKINNSKTRTIPGLMSRLAGNTLYTLWSNYTKHYSTIKMSLIHESHSVHNIQMVANV